MNKINLAVVGFGRIGKIHADNIISSKDATLKMIIDPIFYPENQLSDIEIKLSKNLDDLFETQNIDGVVICSPSNFHIDQIKKISQKIKHIFCEKPLGLSINEIMDIKTMVDNKSLNLHIGFNRRFDPDFSNLKKSLSTGDIGDIHTIKIISKDPSPPPIGYIKKSGGMFLDMTIHDFDMVKYLSGSEISEIYAKGNCFIYPEIEEANDIDTAIINMSLNNGILATIINSRKAAYGYDQRVEVLGSKGILKVGNKLLHGVQKGTEKGFESANPKNFFIDRYEMSYKKEMSSFIKSIKGEEVDYANVDDSLHALKSGLAAKESLLNNKQIMV